MSFLSRRPSRPGNRGADAGRDDEYDDHDYAPDGYVRDARSEEDENWSANEYFSPEGIKGRWAAGHQPGENPAVRGNRDSGRGYDDGGGYNGYDAAGRDRPERARGAADAQEGDPQQDGYGTDDYATGAYDLPDGTDEERTERGSRKRKSRGEWGSRLGLRRDRGEDIWPEDGVSDEDYWASVAADRPLPQPNSPLEADPTPAAADPRPPAPLSDPRPPGNDPRFGGEQRGGSGRLGPAPGLVSDVSVPGRPATGPHAIRPGTGSDNAWSGQARSASGGFSRPDVAQPSFSPSFSPNGAQPLGSQSLGSPPRADWGERTERIERVNASGYPDPRPTSRSHPPGLGAAPTGAPSRSRTDSGSWSRTDSGSWRAADRREPSRDLDREPGRNGGAWSGAGRNGAQAPARAAGDEDPLTSNAYSRSALGDADGRSYRVAARRSQSQSQLTEETQTFSAPGQYSNDRYSADQYQAGQRSNGPSPSNGEPPARRYPTGGTGEYGQYGAGPYSTDQYGADKYGADKYGADKYGADQYRGGSQRGDAQEPTAQYPAYGSQPTGQQPGTAARQGQVGSVRQPGLAPQQPGQPTSNSGRVSLPGASGGAARSSGPAESSGLTGQYPAQPRQTQQPQTRQPAQSALPAGGNPYESPVTGAYPYPGQAGYPARPGQAPVQPPAQAAPGSDGRDDRRRRPAPPDQGRGTGAGYGAPRDDRY
jgi:hypothetical protein